MEHQYWHAHIKCLVVVFIAASRRPPSINILRPIYLWFAWEWGSTIYTTPNEQDWQVKRERRRTSFFSSSLFWRPVCYRSDKNRCTARHLKKTIYVYSAAFLYFDLHHSVAVAASFFCARQMTSRRKNCYEREQLTTRPLFFLPRRFDSRCLIFTLFSLLLWCSLWKPVC